MSADPTGSTLGCDVQPTRGAAVQPSLRAVPGGERRSPEQSCVQLQGEGRSRRAVGWSRLSQQGCAGGGAAGNPPATSASSAASLQWAIACAELQPWELMAFCFSLPAGDVSLHLTTFSLQYTPPVVACVCIHLACKWSNWEIPVSTDGKHWWEYVDGTVTLELLDGKFWSEVPPNRLLYFFFLGISVPAIQTRPLHGLKAFCFCHGFQCSSCYGTTEMAKGTER